MFLVKKELIETVLSSPSFGKQLKYWNHQMGFSVKIIGQKEKKKNLTQNRRASWECKTAFKSKQSTLTFYFAVTDKLTHTNYL